MLERILIVGHGSIGRRHLGVVRQCLPKAKILVMRHEPTSTIPERADAVCSSLQEALSFGPRAAVIANPAPFHCPVATELLKAGCHVLIEKPLASSLIDATALLGDTRASGVVCQVGYNLRFMPSLQEFRRLVMGGCVGRVLSVRSEISQYLPSWRPGMDYRQGVSAQKAMGGGVLLELSHEIDYLRWIFGEVSWVSAWLGRLGDLEIDVEDSAQMTLGFAGEARRGMGRAGDDGAPVGSLQMDFLRHDTTRCCTVIGSEGSLRWDGVAGVVDFFSAKDPQWLRVWDQRQQPNESYLLQWQHFVDCVNTNASPLVGASDGVAVLEIIEAARHSAAHSYQRESLLEAHA
jgi:predicted dehydrogenase